MERALFLDRDGVLNVDHGYVGTVERFEVIHGVADALKRAARLGYLLVVVTNQSGIARGYFTSEDYARVERHMVSVFAAEGVHFTGIYHCPHHPDDARPDVVRICTCRKPGPGLILQACAEHAIDRARSIMIGDRPSDLAAGKAAGIAYCFLISARATGDEQTFSSLAHFVGSPTFQKLASAV